MSGTNGVICPEVVPAQAGVFQETLENDNADSGRPRAGGGVPVTDLSAGPVTYSV